MVVLRRLLRMGWGILASNLIDIVVTLPKEYLQVRIGRPVLSTIRVMGLGVIPMSSWITEASALNMTSTTKAQKPYSYQA